MPSTLFPGPRLTTPEPNKSLIDLAAVEAIDVMRDASRREAVDLSLVGDEEDVEIAMGLRQRRVTPAPSYHIVPLGWLDQPDAGGMLNAT